MTAPPAGEDGWPASRLWDMALKVYAVPGVAATCLDLQDRRGIDTCLLLLGLWCGHEGLRLDDDAVARCRAEAARWAGELIRPLRGVRRRLKSRLEALATDATAGPVTAVRQSLAAAEIGLERAELILLERCVATVAATVEPGRDAAMAAMHILTGLCEPDRRQVEELLDAAFARA